MRDQGGTHTKSPSLTRREGCPSLLCFKDVETTQRGTQASPTLYPWIRLCVRFTFQISLCHSSYGDWYPWPVWKRLLCTSFLFNTSTNGQSKKGSNLLNWGVSLFLTLYSSFSPPFSSSQTPKGGGEPSFGYSGDSRRPPCPSSNVD